MMWSGHCLAGHFVLVSNTVVEALESGCYDIYTCREVVLTSPSPSPHGM